MSSFDDFLAGQLDEIATSHLHRTLRTISSAQGPHIVLDGREVLNFSSNDYLGLAADPRLIEASIEAARRYGAGAGASRLISGNFQPQVELEERLASFKGTEAALVFSTGYATALGTIQALLSAGDFIVIDKLVHASIVDAARLCGATLRVFAHNDLNDLEEILRWCSAKRKENSRILIVTESVFSMDGDIAPLREIADLKERYSGWMMVDEAHAVGVFGQSLCGLVDELGLSSQVEIQMGTLGKALGSSGGFIAGSLKLRDYLINRARSLIFSTAPPPAASAAAKQAIDIVVSEGRALSAKLRANIQAVPQGRQTPIIPVMIGDERRAVDLSKRLLENGIFVPAIRFPTVARNKARLRISVTARHAIDEVHRLLRLLT